MNVPKDVNGWNRETREPRYNIYRTTQIRVYVPGETLRTDEAVEHSVI